MADYDFKYRLQSAPQARLDGSGCVMHDIYAISQEQGNGGYSIVPGRHKSIAIPAHVIDSALAQPTNPERIAAYKDALVSYLDYQPTPIYGWSAVQLEALMDANDAAQAAAQAVNEFVTVTLGLSYPVDFAL